MKLKGSLRVNCETAAICGNKDKYLSLVNLYLTREVSLTAMLFSGKPCPHSHTYMYRPSCCLTFPNNIYPAGAQVRPVMLGLTFMPPLAQKGLIIHIHSYQFQH